MMLTFDITGAPPSLTDIAAERDRAQQTRVAIQKKNVRFVILSVVVGLSLLCFQWFVNNTAVQNSDANPTVVGVIALYTPKNNDNKKNTTLTLHHKLIEMPRNEARATLDALDEATRDERLAIDGAEQAEIISSRGQVAALVLALVIAVIEAIQRWLNKRKPAAD